MVKSNNTAPNTAMVLAAGLGKRMRSFSSAMPKPMVEVGGVSLINRVLNKLSQARISNAVVNLHHKGGQIEQHLAKRVGDPAIAFSHENTLLETGGGVKNALSLLGDNPFFVINSDALWHDHKTNALTDMQQFWDKEKMDVLLLLYATKNIPDYQGSGDFYLETTGLLSRPDDGKTKPYIFTGVQIINPDIMSEFSEGVFSLNKVYDKANSNGRLFGMAHKGIWHHVGCGAEVEVAERFYTKN